MTLIADSEEKNTKKWTCALEKCLKMEANTGKSKVIVINGKKGSEPRIKCRKTELEAVQRMKTY